MITKAFVCQEAGGLLPHRPWHAIPRWRVGVLRLYYAYCDARFHANDGDVGGLSRIRCYRRTLVRQVTSYDP